MREFLDKVWNEVCDFAIGYLGISRPVMQQILWTIAIILLYVLLRMLLSRMATRRVKDITRKYILTKVVNYVLGLVALIALFRVWFGGGGGLAAYLGIVSAGVAIALRDPLVNLAGWLYIMIRKPFVIGDRIQIHEHRGDVIDISLFQFSLIEIGNWVDADQSTGRVIHVPNGWVFQHTTSNYTQGFSFIWHEIPVTITFESNWQKAKEILTRIGREFSAVQSQRVADEIRQAAHKFLIFYEHLTPIVWTSVADIGVTLTLRYLCEPRQRRSSSEKIWEAVLEAFAAEEDIDFAYPTQRFYDNAAEGKSGTGGPRRLSVDAPSS